MFLTMESSVVCQSGREAGRSSPSLSELESELSCGMPRRGRCRLEATWAVLVAGVSFMASLLPTPQNPCHAVPSTRIQTHFSVCVSVFACVACMFCLGMRLHGAHHSQEFRRISPCVSVFACVARMFCLGMRLHGAHHSQEFRRISPCVSVFACGACMFCLGMRLQSARHSQELRRISPCVCVCVCGVHLWVQTILYLGDAASPGFLYYASCQQTRFGQ
jgi:hypothetical protein